MDADTKRGLICFSLWVTDAQILLDHAFSTFLQESFDVAGFKSDFHFC
jgi:hypothetical protein